MKIITGGHLPPTPLAFIERIHPRPIGFAVLAAIRPAEGDEGRNEVQQGWLNLQREDWHHTAERFITRYAATHNLYLTVADYREATQRNEANVLGLRWLYREADDVPLPAHFPPPSLVVETSPGRKHEWWELHAPLDVPTAKRYLTAIADTSGLTHAAVDAARVLRLPSTPNHNRSGCMVRTLDDHPDRVYDLAAFAPILAAAPAPQTQRRAGDDEELVLPGGRREALLSLAGAMRRYGAHEADIAHALHAFNERRCAPPLDASEVQALAEDVAQRYPEVREAVRNTGTTDGEDDARAAGPYTVHDGRICWRKPTKEGSVLVPLGNFAATITEEVISDDGVEQRGDLAVTGTLASGEPLPLMRVPLAQFAAMNWPLTAWGTRAVVSAGMGAKDRLREAIQLLSPAIQRRTEYAHTGWRQIGGQWVFLHAGGAIGADGPVPDVVVQLTGSLVRAVLPDPPAGAERIAAIRASLALLDLARLPITAPLLGAVYRAPLNAARLADVTVALIGSTGVRKSELAALAQQHTGAGFDRMHLPAAWSATANALERLLFVMKDTVAVIDDFAPTGPLTEQARLHGTADRVIRGAGNGAARGRMRADGGLRPDYPPRGLAIVTGEEAPRGQSLKGRMVIVAVSPGDVALDRLTHAQRHGADGILAAAFAGYVQWLAPRMDTLTATVRDDLAILRDEAREHTAHTRTPENVAHLALGWRYWLDYAEDAGAITSAEHEALWERLWAALGTTATAQREHQYEEPAQQFLTFVLAAIQSGEGHIAALDGNAPGHGEDAMWGWRVVERDTANGETLRTVTPQGKCIGWLDREHDLLYLQPDGAYVAAQRMAAAGGSALPVAVRTLGRRLHERGLLATTGGQGEYTVKRMVAGRKTRVLCVSPTALSSLTAGTSGTTPRTAHGEGENTVPDDAEAAGTTGTRPDYPGLGTVGGPDTASQTSGHDEVAGTQLAHREGEEPGIPDVPADFDSRLDSVTTHYTRAQMRMWLDHAAGQKTLTTIPVGVRAFASARGINQRRDESPMQFVARLRAALWGEAA